MRGMRRLSILLVLLAVGCFAAVALADGPPSPAAVSACQAEAAQLGKDAFVAKYGPTEPWGHCYAQHATVTTATTATTTTTEAPPPPRPAPPKPTDSQVRSLVLALCKGRGDVCGAKVRAAVASCLASSSSKDALRACLAAAVPAKRR